MSSGLVALSFAVIALMRVLQKIGSKKVSAEIEGSAFFCYGAYYNLLSAAFSFIALIGVGFAGVDMSTVLYALVTGVCLAVELFASLEGLKGASLIINQMFSVGAIVIPCIVGIFLFNEPVSVWEWIGLAIFFVAICFIVAQDENKQEKSNKISFRTIIMLLLTLVAGGGTMVAQKAFAIFVPNGNIAAYSFLMFALNALILFGVYACVYLTKKRQLKNNSQMIKKNERKVLSKTALIQGLILAFAVFLINMLVTNLGRALDSAILFSVSYAISIVITVLVGVVFYKERLTAKNIIGIILCMGALCMMNFL